LGGVPVVPFLAAVGEKKGGENSLDLILAGEQGPAEIQELC